MEGATGEDEEGEEQLLLPQAYTSSQNARPGVHIKSPGLL